MSAPRKYELVETYKIWDSDEYAAFTSLVKYKGWYVCAFREAKSHNIDVTDSETLGKIRLIRSKDAKNWELIHTIRVDSADLRDPKLSVSPKDELVLIFGRRDVKDGKAGSMVTDVVKYKGRNLRKREQRQIDIKDYSASGTWLWSLRWNGDTAYGFVYGSEFFLVKTHDAIHYEVVCKQQPFNLRGTESDIVFKDNMAIVVVRGGKDDEAILGKSVSPFENWDWKILDIGIGGPSLKLLDNNDMILAGRNYRDDLCKTSIYRIFDNDSVEKIVTLPSSMDSSYPSILQEGNEIYITYYSSEKGNSDIYLSKLRINNSRHKIININK